MTDGHELKPLVERSRTTIQCCFTNSSELGVGSCQYTESVKPENISQLKCETNCQTSANGSEAILIGFMDRAILAIGDDSSAL